MTPYVPYLKNLSNDQKELIFQATLARQLALSDYRFMRPAPDAGTDILIFDVKQNFICPAQLKSSFGIWYVQQGRIRRHLVNIRASRLEASFGRKFLFFFGLYKPDTNPPDFHIGCIPSLFFQEHWEFLKQKKLQKDGRLNIEIDYYVNEERYFMFIQPLVEITPYFNNLDAII